MTATPQPAAIQGATGRLFGSLALSPPRAALALAAGVLLSVAGVIWAPVHPAAAILLAMTLAWAAAVDLDRFILPDAITLGLVLAGLAFHSPKGLEALAPYVIGAVAGFLSLALTDVAYRRFRGRAGLGMGDAKLFAAAGAWLGWEALAPVLLAASLAALVWVGAYALIRRRLAAGPIPFGPFIAAGFWALLLVQ